MFCATACSTLAEYRRREPSDSDYWVGGCMAEPYPPQLAISAAHETRRVQLSYFSSVISASQDSGRVETRVRIQSVEGEGPARCCPCPRSSSRVQHPSLYYARRPYKLYQDVRHSTNASMPTPAGVRSLRVQPRLAHNSHNFGGG